MEATQVTSELLTAECNDSTTVQVSPKASANHESLTFQNVGHASPTSATPTDDALPAESSSPVAIASKADSVVVTTDPRDLDIAGSAPSKPDVLVNNRDDSTIKNPFGYIDNGFTSEIFKVEITNLPAQCGIAQIKKKLKMLGVPDICKIKMPGRGYYVFITFRSEEERADAIKKIDGVLWKGKNLKVKIAQASADPMLQKRKQIKESDCDIERKMRKLDQPGGDISNGERVNNSVTTLWKMTYDQQIESKTKEVSLFMRKLGNTLYKDNATLITMNKRKYKGFCCDFNAMVESPITTNYRSKCEFTISTDSDNNDNTVGFRVGAYVTGNLSVVMPTECVHVPQNCIDICKCVQDYLQMHSVYSSFNPVDKSGHYRTLTTRVTLRGDLMLMLSFYPGSCTQEDIEKERLAVKNHFNIEKYNNIKSFYFEILHETPGRDQKDSVERHLLFGDEYLTENLMNLNFRISPNAFFQINPYCTKLLYTLIGDWAIEGKRTQPILLDICCGTGTIGLTLAKRVKKVIGIEMCKEAVIDAEFNATSNAIDNAEFMCGKAENVLPDLVDKLPSDSEVIAIVDPPRSGLHNDVIRAIRRTKFIKHLVYVSCNPKAVTTNIVDLTKNPSKKMKGAPFVMMKATPFDMFPQTVHYELVMLFTRE